jgi:4-diphosphocytidyl-2-C-methyl-D-erythritol kinase
LVTPLAFEARDYLLVLPPFGVDTAAVYREWDARPSHEEPNHLAVAALSVEPRLARWRNALGDLTGCVPRLAGSGSTWFVEGGPPDAGTEAVPELLAGGERGRLVRTRTVPTGWDGT